MPFTAYYPRVDPPLIARLGSVLRPCALGAIFVIIDISYSDPMITFDFAHDAIGYTSILIGLARLRPLAAAHGRVGWLAFITGIAWLSVADSVLGFLTAWASFDLPRQLLDLAQILALGFFLLIMRRFCEAAMALDLVRSWNRSFYAWLIVYAIPIVPLTILGLVIAATGGEPIRIEASIGVLALLLLAVALVPFVLIVHATVRTMRWVPPARLVHCHVCGYPVVDLVEPRCPECGTLFATERGSSEPGAFREGAGGVGGSEI